MTIKKCLKFEDFLQKRVKPHSEKKFRKIFCHCVAYMNKEGEQATLRLYGVDEKNDLFLARRLRHPEAI